MCGVLSKLRDNNPVYWIQCNTGLGSCINSNLLFCEESLRTEHKLKPQCCLPSMMEMPRSISNMTSKVKPSNLNSFQIPSERCKTWNESSRASLASFTLSQNFRAVCASRKWLPTIIIIYEYNFDKRSSWVAKAASALNMFHIGGPNTVPRNKQFNKRTLNFKIHPI